MYRFDLRRTVFQLIVVIFSGVPVCLSEIKNIRVIDDARPLILFERFGFSEKGHVSVSARDVSWRSRDGKAQLKPSSMGFFVVRDASFPGILNESQNTGGLCVLSSHYVKPVLRFDKLNNQSTGDGSVELDDADEYNLVFGNCQPEFHVSMHVRTEMYNVIVGRKDFLPAGQAILPALYFLFFLLYSCFSAMWVAVCLKNRSNLGKIHVIMGALLVIKALKMACAYEDKLFVRQTGTPHGWDVPFYVFGFFKGIMLFTVITLIGTGWTFLKPYLQEREKNVLMSVIPLQVLENTAYVVISETGPSTKEWIAWKQMFLLLDIVCCCAVFFPIGWSIRSLQEASKTDGKAARNLQKLTLFKQFYIVVIGYLYFTRIVVSAIGAMLNYRYEWVMYASAEGASLAFYVYTFYNFQPVERNLYLAINEEEESQAEQMSDDDDAFEL